MIRRITSWTTKKPTTPFAAAAEQQLKPMTTTLLKAAYSVTTATTAKLSPANTVATESGLMTTLDLTVCRSAIPATTITTLLANAAGALFTVITPTTAMTMITPTATGATRNVRTAPFMSTTTSPNRYFTATQSAISAWNLKSMRVARMATTQIRFWVSATGLRSTSTLNLMAVFQTVWKS